MYNLVIVAVIAAATCFAFVHFHLLTRIEAHLSKGAVATPVPNGPGVNVTVNAGNGHTQPPSDPVAAAPVEKSLPDGVTWADEANGLVSIAALEQYYPGRKYAVKQAEDFLTPGTAAYIGIVQNVQNSTFAEAHDMIQYGVFHPAKPNGLTAGYSLDLAVDIAGVFVCPDTCPTFESVIHWCTATAQAVAANPANQGGGAGFVPGH